jgi:hypothetical protein
MAKFPSRLSMWILIASCLSLVGLSSPAHAVTPAEKATAEALFDEGVAALKSGNLDLACQKLESSQRIEAGVGVLLYLGDCYEKKGRTASAWAIFREAASIAAARGDDRAPIARERADRLTSRLSKLTITMDQGSDMSLPDLELTRDGESIPRELWGNPIPIDPGEHIIAAVAPGYGKEEVKVTIEGGAASIATIAIPHLEKLPEAPKAATAPEPGDSGSTSIQRPLGVVLGIAGLAGLAVGGTFGILAIAKNNEVTDPNGSYGCTNTCPDQGGTDATQTALTFATVSDVGFIAGGVLLATGVTLYLTAPKAKETARLSPSLSPSALGLNLRGTF